MATRSVSKDDSAGGLETSKWLVGSTLVATTFLAFFGIEGEGLGRLTRVHPEFLVLGAALLVVALGLGFLTLSHVRDARRKKILQVAGLGAFAGGVFVLLFAHANATAEQQRPTVAAALSATEAETTIEVTLTAAGLKPEEYLFVIVQGASASDYLDARRAGLDSNKPEPITNGEYSLQPLYKGRVGPSPAGDLDISLAVPVTQGLYDQVWAKARIIDSDEASDEEGDVEEEVEVEIGPSGFPCSQETVDTACAVLLMPDIANEFGRPSNKSTGLGRAR